jgi:transcriptional regulator GlxA family with amidase domain
MGRDVPVQRPSTVRHRTSLFEDAMRIVDEEYAAELSLDDIARRIATSRRQLQRSFAEVGETTFREHVARVRMHKAAELLRDPSLTVGVVSRRVGYRQQAQFAKAFRREFGLPPAEFRRKAPPPDDPPARGGG